eukprot:546672-Hanusia_phi.AAC.1
MHDRPWPGTARNFDEYHSILEPYSAGHISRDRTETVNGFRVQIVPVPADQWTRPAVLGRTVTGGRATG